MHAQAVASTTWIPTTPRCEENGGGVKSDPPTSLPRMIGHALLAFAAGAALGAAALYAAWVYLLPIGTVSDVVSEDRAIASYVLLFSFHIVNALFDQCTGAFRDARTWEKRPDAREYRLLWPAFLAFWIATHSPLAFTGSYYFAYWSLVDAPGLAASRWSDLVNIVAAQAVPSNAIDAALRAVSASGICALALYAGRVGVVVLPPSAPRLGLRRLTDQPLWAVLTIVGAAEAARAAAVGASLADARVAVPLLVACWTLAGGTHQNLRYASAGQRWCVAGADLGLAARELLLPLGFATAFAAGSVLWFLMSGTSGFLAALQGINLLATLQYGAKAATALRKAAEGGTVDAAGSPPADHPFARLVDETDAEALARPRPRRALRDATGRARGARAAVRRAQRGRRLEALPAGLAHLDEPPGAPRGERLALICNSVNTITD